MRVAKVSQVLWPVTKDFVMGTSWSRAKRKNLRRRWSWRISKAVATHKHSVARFPRFCWVWNWSGCDWTLWFPCWAHSGLWWHWSGESISARWPWTSTEVPSICMWLCSDGSEFPCYLVWPQKTTSRIFYWILLPLTRRFWTNRSFAHWACTFLWLLCTGISNLRPQGCSDTLWLEWWWALTWFAHYRGGVLRAGVQEQKSATLGLASLGLSSQWPVIGWLACRSLRPAHCVAWRVHVGSHQSAQGGWLWLSPPTEEVWRLSMWGNIHPQ